MPTSHGKIELIICSVHSEYQLLIIWVIHTNNDFTDYNRLFPASTSTSSSKVDTMGMPTRLMVAEGWVGHLFQTWTSFGSIWHIPSYHVTMLYYPPILIPCNRSLPILIFQYLEALSILMTTSTGWEVAFCNNKQNWDPRQLIFTARGEIWHFVIPKQKIDDALYGIDV